MLRFLLVVAGILSLAVSGATGYRMGQRETIQTIAAEQALYPVNPVIVSAQAETVETLVQLLGQQDKRLTAVAAMAAGLAAENQLLRAMLQGHTPEPEAQDSGPN